MTKDERHKFREKTSPKKQEPVVAKVPVNKTLISPHPVSKN
jgi:hypothetical protein